MAATKNIGDTIPLIERDGSGGHTPYFRADPSSIAAPPAATAANTPAILTAGGDVIAANANRKGWSIQNLGTNPLFVRMGTGASSTVFHMVLKAGTGNDDGLGGVISDDRYTGIVSATGTSPRLVVTELT